MCVYVSARVSLRIGGQVGRVQVGSVKCGSSTSRRRLLDDTLLLPLQAMGWAGV